MIKKIQGTSERPRLYIFKSNKHIYAQLIDDTNNKIITSMSTISKEIKENITPFANCKNAEIIGKHIAIKSKEKGITKVVLIVAETYIMAKLKL